MLGCFRQNIPKAMGNPEWGIKVTWHGHSCFTLEDSVGRTVVIDPFDSTVGYGFLNLRADVVFVTHNHFDHNATKRVRPKRLDLDLVESTGTIVVAGNLAVTGIGSSHDSEGGEVHGPNRIYKFTMGGLKIAHLGDLGQTELSPSQISRLGQIDVLFVPVGGVTTIGPKKAKEIVALLKPSVVFPMHYGDIRFFKLEDVSKFQTLFSESQIRDLQENTVQIKLSELPQEPEIITLLPTERNY